MTIKAHPENGGYVLKDDEGYIYGHATKKREAEQLAEDWNAYYSAPLVFTVTGAQ